MAMKTKQAAEKWAASMTSPLPRNSVAISEERNLEFLPAMQTSTFPLRSNPFMFSIRKKRNCSKISKQKTAKENSRPERSGGSFFQGLLGEFFV